jgi:two-component system, NtrC family, response regulator HupR/HoxA
VTPVGDNRPRTVDVRVVSATNRDLAAEVEAGRFREDVFYRLAAFPIRLPALRERREDVPLIADRILAQAAQRHGKRIAGIEPDAMALLLRHEWRGNVRELQNEVERAVALALDGGAITVEHLSRRLTAEVPVMPLRPVDDATTTPTTGDVTPLRNARVAFEASYIADALRRHRGNVSRTAQALGLSRVMLQKKMKDYGLRSS